MAFEHWRAQKQAPRRGLRTRVEVLVTLVVAVALGALIVLPQVLGGGGSEDVVRTQAGPTTTSTEGPTTTLPPDVDRGDQSAAEQPPTTPPPTTVPDAPTTAAPAPVVAAAPGPPATTRPTPSHTTTTVRRTTTTTAPPPCHNSTEPRCGAFSWDPDPGPNNPMSVSVRSLSDDIHVGQPVSFRISASDPDAAVDGVPNCAASFGENGSTSPCRSQLSCAGNQYGPWSPPPRQAGSYSGDVTHTYSSPGFYKVTVYVNANGACPHDPYRSQGEASISITVSP